MVQLLVSNRFPCLVHFKVSKTNLDGFVPLYYFAEGETFQRGGVTSSLSTDPLFSLKSLSSARDKNKNSGELNDHLRMRYGT